MRIIRSIKILMELCSSRGQVLRKFHRLKIEQKIQMPSFFDLKLNVKGKYQFLVTDDTQILATQTVRTACIRTVFN